MKTLKEIMSTGAAISGTQSAENDPSTPLAPEFFKRVLTRKDFKRIKKENEGCQK
jgi:hypothetical protein